jgi:hypothetical protein
MYHMVKNLIARRKACLDLNFLATCVRRYGVIPCLQKHIYFLSKLGGVALVFEYPFVM